MVDSGATPIPTALSSITFVGVRIGVLAIMPLSPADALGATFWEELSKRVSICGEEGDLGKTGMEWLLRPLLKVVGG
ncbi:hypothetical protein NHP190002_00840 [Helicobacter ailurogastricus]|nr:hypothetical protein ASB7_11570 [Helicobacter ailurogastricus]GLH57401.1 hypothetical protein NHP214376_01880 [Helicobacter ailurogastricus]GLH58773.1 hypothetical protein NHP214377_00370 [Helicobacter ailurogastricus]GMB89407.1 hypothetical protein NHP190002_00840 [Helicobacter ailurogastricus]GMB90956.1 hypothetical protein NHP190009_01210 [Helicobacter ailurogastricus]